MGDLQANIEKLLQFIVEKGYEGVVWKNGIETPLSADYLNISEDALRDLLKVDNTSSDGISDGGIIQKILYIIQQEISIREQLGNDLNNSIDGISDFVNQLNKIIEEQLKPKDIELSNEITNINDNLSEKIDINTKSISDNLEKILKLTTTSEDLTKDVTKLKSDVLTLSDEVDSLSNNMNPEIDTTNIIMNNDEVILRCGSSTEVLFSS